MLCSEWHHNQFVKLFFRLFVAFALLNLISFISALRINCDYVAVKNLISTCKTSDLEVSNPNETVTSMSGTLPGVLDYAKVTSFEIKSSPALEFLPRDIQKFFPNLEKISISNTGLKIITSDNLRNFTKLKSLILRNNKLNELDYELLKFNPNIEEIDLSGNDLKYLGKNILKPLESLKKFDISNNICANETANNPSEIRKLKIKLNENCRHPQNDTSAFKSSASFVAVCLMAILLCVLLIRCLKFIVNKWKWIKIIFNKTT